MKITKNNKLKIFSYFYKGDRFVSDKLNNYEGLALYTKALHLFEHGICVCNNTIAQLETNPTLISEGIFLYISSTKLLYRLNILH